MEDKKRHSPSRGQTFLGKAVSLEGVDTLGRKAERPAGLWGGGIGSRLGWGERGIRKQNMKGLRMQERQGGGEGEP